MCHTNEYEAVLKLEGRKGRRKERSMLAVVFLTVKQSTRLLTYWACFVCMCYSHTEAYKLGLPWAILIYTDRIFSRGHATLHLAVSVGMSVRHISEFLAVFAVLLLPNRPRLDCRVSGLVSL